MVAVVVSLMRQLSIALDQSGNSRCPPSGILVYTHAKQTATASGCQPGAEQELSRITMPATRVAWQPRF